MTTICPTCNTANSDGARFCINCAATIASSLTCPACGTVNPTQARYCLNCAAPLRGISPSGGLVTGMLPASTLLQGRYLIMRRVGQGGMGAVYEATDTRITGKRWAIKELSDAALATPEDKHQAADAFRQEAQMLATLSHPNLPVVSDFFSEDSKQYLVMEFVDGDTLEERLQATSGFLKELQVLDWAVQVCDVLTYLHNQTPQIVFRDLKPANIMVDRQDRVKLIDFGIARLFKPGKAGDTQVMGTPGYAAPEQYGKAQTDPRGDVYSLGVTLHRLLTGYDPADTPFNLPPVRSLNPAVSTHMAAAIEKATQSAAAARHQSAADMKATLIEPSARQAFPQQAVATAPSAGHASPAASIPAAAQVTFTPAQPSPAEAVAPSRSGSDRRLMKRAGLWGYLITIALLGGVGGLACRVLPLAWWLVDGIGFAIACLAAIVTRRPGAAALSFGLFWFVGPFASNLFFLAIALATELVFLITRYRRCDWWISVCAGLSGAGVFDLAVIVVYGGQSNLGGYTTMIICGLVGGLVAWIIGRLFKAC